MFLRKLNFVIFLYILTFVNGHAQEVESSIEEQLEVFSADNNVIASATRICTNNAYVEDLGRCFGIDGSQCISVISEVLSRCLGDTRDVIFRDGVDYGEIDEVTDVERCVTANIVNQGLDNGFVAVSGCE